MWDTIAFIREWLGWFNHFYSYLKGGVFRCVLGYLNDTLRSSSGPNQIPPPDMVSPSSLVLWVPHTAMVTSVAVAPVGGCACLAGMSDGSSVLDLACTG